MGLCAGKEEDLVPFASTGGSVHCLICCLDYTYSPGHELTCSKDGEAIRRIAHHAGAAGITVVNDHHDIKDPKFPTRNVVVSYIKEVASRCKAGDWFVWFYAGHGVNVSDHNAEEADGFDEAFVTPEEDTGRLSEGAVLIDDDFSKALDTFIPDGVRILCICDCCHSGTICDIDSHRYQHDIYQLSASLDSQQAEDTGHGGVLTRALRKTLLELGFAALASGSKEFSLQKVFDGCASKVSRFTQEQEVAIAWHGADPRTVAWPLCFPVWKYAGRVPAELEDSRD